MTKVLSPFLLLACALLFSGCENAELNQCIESKSPLWDNRKDDPSTNKRYWDAIKLCREKYG